ncbi:MAG TPA: PIN domain-containing protein [Roseiflexaceae bacterium]|nr:PIN domain-containing protein [Roseiflexaceae bacterium]
MDQDTLWKQFMSLPREARHEVADFIAFLQSKYRGSTAPEGVSDIATNLIRQYRLSHGLLIADAFIAATAITLGVPLVSKNQRDFRFISQLTLLPYP